MLINTTHKKEHIMAEQIENGLEFDLPKNKSSIIKVIGVGGGGSNAVNHMKQLGIKGVDFVVCNTDAQALAHSPVENRIQLGANLTEGLGAGANPEVGKHAAEETKNEILEVLKSNTKMVFITAGMGGGTGTGAAPVIAKFAKELNILTVGIVTKPFKFEGRVREKQALEGIEELRQNVDSLIVINNDKLREVYGNLSFRAGFAKADEVLATAAKGIAEVITYHFTTNIDLKDVRTVLENSGTAIMGSASASGTNRATDAVIGALDSPLLNDNHIAGANNVLLLIVSSGDQHEITMDEMSLINEHIQREAGGNANVIMGIGIDNELSETIGVTVIATGFPASRHNILAGKAPEKIVHTLEDDQPVTQGVFTKPMADVDAPDKPIAKKPERQPDLFSHTAETIVHGLYEPEVADADDKPLVEDTTTENSKVDYTSTVEANAIDETETTEMEVPEIEPTMAEEEKRVIATIDDFEAPEPVLPIETTNDAYTPDSENMGAEIEAEETTEAIMESEVYFEDVAENEFVFDLNDFSETPKNEPIEESTEAKANFEEESTISDDVLESSDRDETTFALDDIDGEGIYITPENKESEVIAVSENEIDPFEMPIGATLANEVPANEAERQEPKVEMQAEDKAVPQRVVHTLDDLRELEQRLQIKTPSAETQPQPVEKAETEDDSLKFELKTKNEPIEVNSREEDDFLNRPLTPEVRRKLLERKARLEAFVNVRTSNIEMLEKETAFKRQGLDIGMEHHSSASTVSRMQLDGEKDETEIKTNNSFLHDNVD